MQQPQKTLTLLRLQAPFRGSASSCCSRPSMLVLPGKKNLKWAFWWWGGGDQVVVSTMTLFFQTKLHFNLQCNTNPTKPFLRTALQCHWHSSVTKENQLPFPAVLRFLNKLPMDSLRFIPGALACKVSWQGLGMDSIRPGFWPRPHIETEHPSTSARRAWGVPLGCEELVAWSPVGSHHFWQCCWLQLKQMWTTVEVRPFQWNRWSSLWKTQNCWVLYRFSNCGQVHRFWSYIKPTNPLEPHQFNQGSNQCFTLEAPQRWVSGRWGSNRCYHRTHLEVESSFQLATSQDVLWMLFSQVLSYLQSLW